jgi:RNA polymerase sigma-70 factor (ECF subfamily)
MQVKAISACPDTDSAPVAGDAAEAFARLYGEYFDRVRGLAYWRVSDRDLAEDLAQETFSHLWEQVAAGAVDLTEVRNPFTWLATRAKWTVGRHYRQARIRTEVALDDHTMRSPAMAEHPIDLVAARIGMGQLILALPFPARRVLALHYLEGLPVPDVAEETGQSVEEVWRHLAEGVQQLRGLLGVGDVDVPAPSARDRARRTTLTRAPSMASEVRELLRAAIRSGRFTPGSVLPSSGALAAQFRPPSRPPVDRRARHDPLLPGPAVARGTA